ncbi:MAG: ester cyclase [Legionella longbeachae]|nr:ester cyclase [Legionella longbeachae]
MTSLSRFLHSFLLFLLLPLSFAASPGQLETNKAVVTAFYNELINQKNFETASQYLGTHFIQHNPMVVDDVDGLRAFVEFLRNKFPDAHSEIKKIFAEGDYVMVHVHSIREPGTAGRAIFDLFKLQNGKIIEHWDVIQDIPVESKNTNGMF